MNRFIKNIVLSAALLFVLTQVNAGPIQGPIFVNTGTTYTYTSSNSTTGLQWRTARGASVSSQTYSGGVYTAKISWAAFMAADGDEIWLLNGNTLVEKLTVYVNCAGVANPATTLSATTNACGNKTITYSGAPASGISWVWMTDPNNLGSYSASTSYSAATTGTYYLRARNSEGCWSASYVQISVNVTPLPPAPAGITASTNACGPQTLTKGTAPFNTTWYWQGTNLQGQSTADATATYTANASGTYYVRALKDACWSTPAAITVSVVPIPTTPTSALEATTFLNGTPTLAVGSVAGATGYRWYSPAGALVTETSLPSYPVTGFTNTITYQVAAVNQGCESPARKAITLTIVPNPQILVEGNGRPVIALGKAIKLFANDAYTTYAWKKNGTLTGSAATLSVTTVGSYALSVTRTGILGTGVATLNVLTGMEGQDLNYIVKNTIQTGNVTTVAAIPNLPLESVQQTIEYFDGLGRSAQTVMTQGSPDEHDIVQPVVYDGFGREETKYLPYIDSDISGWYKYNATGTSGTYAGSPHHMFYTGNNSTVARSEKPYAVTTFEVSPVTRVIKQGAAGADWQPDAVNSYASTDHTVKKSYTFNWVNEALYILPTSDGGGIKIGNTAYYKPNQLTRNATRDEEQHETIEYTDKEGHVVLRSVQVDAATYANTYYVYNDQGQLSAVLPPEASRSIVAALSPTWKTLVGVTLGAGADANGLTKSTTAAGTYGNAGAVSTETLAANADGWVEMVADEQNTSRMIGLSATNADNGVNILYALELRNDGNIYVRENGSAGTLLSNYGATTVVRVSREGGVVKYYKDGRYLQSSATPSTSSLLVDVALQEKGATIKNVTFSFASLGPMLKNWAFLYKYDARQRMAAKRVPSAGWVYMVYDRRDRLVLTQDSVQREGNIWTFIKYDAFNRPILTGIKDTALAVSQALMQQVVNDHYKRKWARYGEEYVGYCGTNIHGYSNRSYPVCTSAATVDENHYLTVTYYDQYNFRDGWYGENYKYQTDGLTLTVRGERYDQQASDSARVKGYVTGSKVKVLDDGVRGGYAWLKTVTYYDKNYRVVQMISDNYKAGIDRQSTLYDFAGKPLLTRTTHSESDVSWTDLVGTRVLGNRLYRNVTNNGWGQSGAASVQMLPAGHEGWVEWTATETNRSRMIGLSDQNIDADYDKIDYAFYLRNDGMLQVRENGAEKPAAGITVGDYKPGDVLRIARVGTSIKYYKNGIELYPAGRTVTQTSSSTPLLVDVAFSHSTGTLVNIRSSFSTTRQTVNRRMEYDNAGRLLATYHTLDGGPEVLLAKNTYNALGQLVDKDLHGVDGASFKQSVDYRYNIRGWLTSINDASLESNGTSNIDDGAVSRDYFGMNLAYNSVAEGIGNTPQFNGNISGVAWSHNQALGAVKQNGYVYTYDAMSRISGSVFQERTGTVWNALNKSRLAEAGITYDLNGNIRSLIRNDRRATGKVMDSLVYDYGTGTAQTNRLLKVTDGGDKAAGFVDGTNTGVDYTYDGNGNLRRDLNKGIGTATNDNDNIITYNFLNLPQTVTKGENTIRYIYDAAGRKLSQQVGVGTGMKQTDYIGEFVYENDALQFVNHEEGRVATARTKLIYTNPGNTLDDVTGQRSTLETVTADSETYIKATMTATNRPGIFPVGDSILVQAGERYKIRAKAYRLKGSASASHAINLLVTVNGKDVNWPGALVPAGATSVKTESWIEQIVTVPVGGTYLKAGVVGNSTIVAGEQLFLNEFEIIKLEDTEAEYQYFLKDHLGNVRLTFTTKDEIDTSLATMETAEAGAERSQFLNYDEAVLVNQAIFDHTNTAATKYSSRLDGVENRYGLAKSISVMPGDVIEAEVWGKYLETNTDSLTAGLKAFLMSISQGNAPAGTVIDGAGSGGAGSVVLPIAALMARRANDGNGPKAYLNYLIYDRNFKPLTQGYRRMSKDARENGSDRPHELLSFKGADKIEITEAGYIYLFLSYEPNQAAGDLMTEIYFDDFQVTHTKSPVVQANDYYPFGLTFNSYSKETSTPNQHLYNSKEQQDEFDLGWMDYGARMYDPTIARWNVLDGMSEKYLEFSPYHYAANSPIRNYDIDGNEFTDAAWLWVVGMLNKLGGEVTRLDKRIRNTDEKLSREGVSDKKKERLENRKERLTKSRNAAQNDYDEVANEVVRMDNSFQIYDVRIDARVGDSDQDKAATVYNATHKRVEFVLGKPNASMSLFAHEFKHGYQFETGQASIQVYSSGYLKLKGWLAYDLTDEIEAYERQKKFGSVPNWKPGYNNRMVNGVKFPSTSATMAQYSNSSHADLQRLANQTWQAFRLNGTSYAPTK